MIDVSPNGVFSAFQKGCNYNSGINLDEEVQVNEDFYCGRQWEGVNAPDIPKPVFNILRRTVAYFCAVIVSDDIGIRLEDFGQNDENKDSKRNLDMLSREIKAAFERMSLKSLYRKAVRNAAVDGDACLHFWFDYNDGVYSMPKQTPGFIKAEALDNTNVFFSDVRTAEVERQRYIIIAREEFTENVKEMLKANGKDEELASESTNTVGVNKKDMPTEGKTLVLRMYYKQNGHVFFTDVIESTAIIDPVDTGLTVYPIAWLPWEEVKNRYHGISAISGMIPNQLFINRLYAMAMRHIENTAFPKIVYDKSKMVKGWSNRVGEAVGVHGNVRDAVMSATDTADMSAQVMQIIRATIDDTRDTMGISDTALGNVRPDNTSAIIATQNATSFPLSLQRMNFYDFVEHCVRIIIDFMIAKYGMRKVIKEKDVTVLQATKQYDFTGRVTTTLEEVPTGETYLGEEMFDFSTFADYDMRLSIDIGASSYWSEITQTTTLSNMLTAGIIPPEIFLKYLPAGQLPYQHEMITDLENYKAKQQQEIQQQALAAAVTGGSGNAEKVS